MKNLKMLSVLGASLALTGCVATANVQGQLTDGSDSFTGTAVGNMDGAGTLSVVSRRGVQCNGNFVYITQRYGEGNFTCDDGRSGPFTFASTGTSGTGSGTLGNQAFTFTFAP